MGQAKQQRQLARQIGLQPLYGTRLARRPRGGDEMRGVGDGGFTLCGDLIYTRSRLSTDEKRRGTRGARRLCGSCCQADHYNRIGCGDVLERHTSENYDNGLEYYETPADVVNNADIKREFGDKIELIRSLRAG